MSKFLSNKSLEQIEQVQKGCSVRIFTLSLLEQYINTIQLKLDAILFKADQKGVEVEITIPFKPNNNYNGAPASTFVILTKSSGSKFIVKSVERKHSTKDFSMRFLNLDKFKEEIAKKVIKENRITH
ncbi:hypothetical protein ACT7SV_001165 [Vibrio cholerae]